MRFLFAAMCKKAERRRSIHGAGMVMSHKKSGQLAAIVFSVICLSPLPLTGAEDCRLIANPQNRLACWDRRGERTADFQAEVIFDLFSVNEAETTCKFTIDPDQYKLTFVRNNLTYQDIYTLPRSPHLQSRIDGLLWQLSKQKDIFCSSIWNEFGPSGSGPKYFKSR
jgi:hypothetical protein